MDQQLEELVESLTTSGEPQLNPAQLKQLKKLCKSSDEQISRVYHLLMTQLNQDHAEIRLSAFQIVGELFTRSHHFRTLLISNFQEFLELTVETDYDQPLPPPKEVAKKLKILAIKTIQEWHEKYGEAYKKLSLGFHFLKQNKKVDFQNLRTQTLAQRKREEEQQKRLENLNKERAKKAMSEMEDMLGDIESCLTEMQNCFKLLLPDPEEFGVFNKERDEQETTSHPKPAHPTPQVHEAEDERPCCSKDLPGAEVPSLRRDSGVEGRLDNAANESGSEQSEDDFEAVEESFIRDHGLGSHKYSLNIEISADLKVTENSDNVDVVNSLMDAHKLAKNKYWPAVQSWIQVFTKAGTSDDGLKRAIDLKKKLEAAMKKHKEMNIDCQPADRRVMKASDEDDDDDEDDFEEVPEKEGYEPRIPDHLRAEYGLDTASPAPEKKVDKRPDVQRSKRHKIGLNPTGAAATLMITQDKKAASDSSPGEPSSKCGKREEDPARAPVIPFGGDLHGWGEDQTTAAAIIRPMCQHRFWTREAEEEVESKELEAFLKTRYITVPGKFEPVEHECRAPLANGSLCVRQDRYKCPFHGKIIPRDELGVPTNQQDRNREAKEQFEKQASEQDWRDPELMRDIEQATGEDLGSSRCPRKGQKKGKGKKKKYPNLTDLKQKANTSRSRLEKKVFNTGSVKRVISAMNKMDQRRHEKFANQFNYALN
ncbi:UV-stimulated scaffold protein A [Pseudophryne corroboree]|uniref:UV-stimulated scaffold protein A n=1 Tax=Pseudophryne corroboree TaxID=495146 RepID=UPI0030816214